MSQTEGEWPLPAYEAELRERVILVLSVEASAVARHVPSPLHPDQQRGKVLVAVTLATVRRLRSVGAETLLASEFGLAEVLVPAWRRPACRGEERGLLLLGLRSSSRGLRRLVASGLSFPAEALQYRSGVDRAHHVCSIGEPAEAGGGTAAVHARVVLPRPYHSAEGDEAPTVEELATQLLRRRVLYVPDHAAGVIRAVPVRHYARATMAVTAELVEAPLVERLLGVPPEALRIVAVLLQRRCTHTWGFPPERIPVVPAPGSAAPRAAPGEVAEPLIVAPVRAT